MNRAGAIQQIRRILLLALGRYPMKKRQSQLALPLAASVEPSEGADLRRASECAHDLLVELTLLTQMELAGLVATALPEQRRRLRIGAAPALRALQEWTARSGDEDEAHQLEVLPLGASGPEARRPATRLQLEEAPPPGGSDPAWGEPERSRERAYAKGLERARALALELGLGPHEVEELIKRLFLLCLEATPRDDLAGLVHGHGERHVVARAPRNRLAFRIDRDRSRGQGVFATPAELIEEIASATLQPAPRLEASNGGLAEPFYLLDPACGTGAFLLAAAPGLVDGEDNDVGVLARLVGLHGVDLDPQAARIAAHNLSLWSFAEARRRQPEFTASELDAMLGPEYPYFLGRQIHVGNALHAKSSTFSTAFLWERRFPWVFERDRPGFDVVVGNPPWVSYGLRDRGAADEEARAYYERYFPAGTQYKLTLYPLFMELAMQLCRAGGVHGMLVPDSVLVGHHFSRIRTRLLEESELIELALVETSAWSGAHVGFTVFYAARKRGGAGSSIDLVRNRILHATRPGQARRRRPAYPIPGLEPEKEMPPPRFESTEVLVPASQYEASGRPLRIFREAGEMAFLAKILKSPMKVRDVAWTYSGLIARYGQKTVQGRHLESRYLLRDQRGREVLNDGEATRRWNPALLSGSEITPYRVDWKGGRLYLPDQREQLPVVYKSGFDLERYRRTKVFLRQTGDRLVAAVDRDGLYCLNNLHLLGGHEGVGVPPLLLAGVLLSRPIQRTYRIFALEGARPLAQVDLKTVESLPYPVDGTGYPIGAGSPPPRTHPQSRALIRRVDRALEAGSTNLVLEVVSRARQAGPTAFEGGTLTGRNALSLVLLHLLEQREQEARNAAPSTKGKDSTALQPALDSVFDLLFDVR